MSEHEGAGGRTPAQPAAPSSMFAALVLAGGGGQRLGGVDKPALAVGGTPMLHRVLAAVGDASPRVVVGPVREGLPGDVVQVREVPPGGGPVAATAAGLAAVVRAMTGSARPPSDQELAHPDRVHPDILVAVLAADLPLLTADALDLLRLQLEGRDADGPGTLDGAVFIDDTGRRQLLCGIWRLPALLRSLSALGDPAGRPIWQLVGGLRVGETLWRTRRAAAGGGAPVGGAVVGRAPVPPWFDCDTEADLQVAKEWTG